MLMDSWSDGSATSDRNVSRAVSLAAFAALAILQDSTTTTTTTTTTGRAARYSQRL